MITIVLTRIFLISYVVKRSKKIWGMLLKNEKKKEKKKEDEIPSTHENYRKKHLFD